MAVWAFPAVILYDSSGKPNGAVYCQTPFGIQYFTGVVSAGNLNQLPKMDFSPPGSSVGIGTVVVMSSGEDRYNASVGTTLTANYIPVDRHTKGVTHPTSGHYVQESWTRTS